MNRLSKNRRAVYTLQRWLCALKNAGMPLPEVIPDGIYGDSTADAVAVFQGFAGLEQTGIVDEKTWYALKKEATACEESLHAAGIYPFGYALRDGKLCAGDSCDLVYVVQVILRALRSQFNDLREQELNGVLDETTKENVSILQRLWGFRPTGDIDLPTWNMLARAFNLFAGRE